MSYRTVYTVSVVLARALSCVHNGRKLELCTGAVLIGSTLELALVDVGKDIGQQTHIALSV